MREEEKSKSSQGFKRFFKKRWALPAAYIASAAIILTGVLWYQGMGGDSDKYDYKSTDIPGKKFNEPSIEVNRAMENFAMPVKDVEGAVIQKRFYDDTAKAEEQEAALVYYNNTYVPNTGLDIAMSKDEAFDVLAALSGTVTRVEEDSLLGNVIEIEHDKGIVTQYQSVKDMKVKVGVQVNKGQVIATAGKSLVNEKGGIHVHFEIRKDGVAVNPLNFFDKPLSALQQEAVEKAAPSEDGVSDQLDADDPDSAGDEDTDNGSPNAPDEDSSNTNNENGNS